ncbi:D-aminoacyl-tRNA deacylase [uncultured Aeromicrobium sp.]|uniref:D-aminoacyl-tRNA deacylase n=1 Tax=uncultured Aeromicrobium sp. TaxID=337820 RepID=UPI0025F09F20|nr:D-aminoacyl-tRNA deacylase [uncultured Aeromicrobium sp.]
MRAVVQRVSRALVSVAGQVVSRIDEPGLLVLLGVTHHDTAGQAQALARKIWGLRILRDELSAAETGAPVLVVSQFTLYADTRKGRRPSWSAAAPGPVAEPLYEEFCRTLEHEGAVVRRGVFGAEMSVELVNDGPVTLVMESENTAR